MDLPFEPKPMRIGAILDSSFWIYRRNFGPILLFSLLIGASSDIVVNLVTFLALPGGLAGVGWQRLLNQFIDILGNNANGIANSDDALNFLQSTAGISSALFASSMLGLAVTILIQSMVTGGITNVASGSYHGVTETASNWFAKARHLYGRFVLTGIAQYLCTALSAIALFIPILLIIFVMSIIFGVLSAAGGGFGLVIFVILILLVSFFSIAMAFTWTTLIFPVAVNEGLFGFRAVGRAFSLFFKNFWRLSLTTLFFYFIIFVLETVIGVGTAALFALTDIPLWISSSVSSLLSAFINPLSTIVPVMLYLDTRIRREGYDLVLRSRNLSHPAPESPNDYR
jgi:hypothetical protein